MKEFDRGIRIQALTLHQAGHPISVILEKTGYSRTGFYCLLRKAKENGYTPGQGPILLEYVENGEGRGRKPVLTAERKQRLISLLTAEDTSRKFTSQQLADLFNEHNESKDEQFTVGRSTVLRAITAEGYSKHIAKSKGGCKIVKKNKSKGKGA